MRKFVYFLLGLVALVLVLMLGAKVLSPVSSLQGEVANDEVLVQRGEYLAKAADCIACHTAPNGQAFAGGLAMPIPFLGQVYTSNITPDVQTGLGQWTLADFDRAVRHGISKNNQPLYPAMPYVSYAKISDDDIKALFTYFRYEVEPVKQEQPNSDIAWPLNMRWPLQYWNLLFAPDKPYQSKADKTPLWNRGAYLVQGLAHCGTCHTPRGLLMQEVALDETGQGYLGGAMLGGWQAYNITPAANAGIGRWSEEQLIQYFRSGNVANLAQAAGPMGEAVMHSFSQLTTDDLTAIATYIRTIPAVNDATTQARTQWGKPGNADIATRSRAVDSELNPQRLFLGACSSCHQANGGGSSDGYYPGLLHNSTVGAANANNLLQVILHGVQRDQVSMPAFAQELSDAQIAALANYVIQQFGNPQTPLVTEKAVAALR